MQNFIIHTDSACDISPELLAEWGVAFTSLLFRFDGEDKEYKNHDMNIADFYQKMREGGVAKTSAINTETFKADFRRTLESGSDLLYLCFSSGLSTTYNSARLAAEALREEFPERKIMVVDTLCASAGLGLLVYLAVGKKNEGASIEETAEYVNGVIPRLCHWFTVDDLVYLKRGGRVSSTAALVGNMLGIKPVLHVDNDGHLVNVAKVRGRKTSITAMADKYSLLAENKEGGPVFISHGDCEAEARELEKIITEKYGARVSLITDIGAVIGAHSGPGTMALFFVGKER